MFEAVAKALVDFDRKIVIESHWRPPEDDPSFSIEHEPVITREDFADEWSGVMLEIWRRHNDGPVPRSLKRSDGRQWLLTLNTTKANGEYVISPTALDREYWARNSAFLELPAGYFETVVNAIAAHPFWENDAVDGGVRIEDS